ncbi:MAG: response regulator [Bacteroidetes bacterium]|nr:response regulator [Bacteroidota bacterium]
MKKIVKNKISLVIAIVGFIGGIIWNLIVNFEPEPIILTIVSFLEILGFFLIPNDKENTVSNQMISNEQKVNVNVNVNMNQNQENDANCVNIKKLTRILFIDDKHRDFNIVSILKKSDWINTKSVVDIKDLDDPKVIEADIIFVDINGVGSTLFKDQGLGLASALKKKYTSKKIIIYSAESTGDRFHKALREVDGCLNKDAEPYQFVNLIEELLTQK